MLLKKQWGGGGERSEALKAPLCKSVPKVLDEELNQVSRGRGRARRVMLPQGPGAGSKGLGAQGGNCGLRGEKRSKRMSQRWRLGLITHFFRGGGKSCMGGEETSI
jgi:hypothetical protein